MSVPSINVFRFLSCENFLRRSIYETQGVNFLHNDLIQCYFQLAEGMGWEQVYDSLVKAADGTVETQGVINAAKRHLDQIKSLKQHDGLPN